MRGSIVASSLLCLPLAAQPGSSTNAVERERSAVLVVDTEGRPWAGAGIVCFYPGVQAYPDLVPQDIVEATSDERGRAAMQLRPGCGYLAWARQPLADGTWRLSQVTRVASGRPIRLAESGAPRPRVRVKIAGLEAWGEEAPFRCFAASSFGWRQELTVKDDGVDVAPLPTPALTVTVYGKSGLVLGSDGVPIADSGWMVHASSSRRESTIQVPPPVDLEVRLKNGGGAPVAGARLLACDQGGHGPPSIRLSEVGRSSPAGAFRLRAAGTLDPKTGQFFIHSTLRVLADRCADRQVGAFGWTLDQCPATSLEDGVLCHEVVLQPGFTLRGRLLTGAEQPAAGTALLMHAYVRSGERHSSGSPAPKLVVVTDSQGRFEVPGCDPTTAYSLWANLDERSYVILAKSAASRLQHRVCLVANAKPDGAALDLGDVRLDELDRWSFQMTEADGSASPCPMLWLEPASSESVNPEPLILDPLGRGTVLAARGTLARVAAGGDASFAWSELGERAPGETIVLRSAALVPIVGQAVDENGKAMSGIQIHHWMRGVIRAPAEKLFSCWFHDWVRKGRVAGSVATDERGGFRFEVVPGFVYEVGARQKPGLLNVTADADATEGGVLDLRLVLDSKVGWLRAPQAGR